MQQYDYIKPIYTGIIYKHLYVIILQNTKLYCSNKYKSKNINH